MLLRNRVVTALWFIRHSSKIVKQHCFSFSLDVTLLENYNFLIKLGGSSMAKIAALSDASQFFEALLEKGGYRGVFGLRKRGDLVHYSLFVDKESLSEFVPFYPLMPVNAARALTFFTFHEKSPYPVAFVARPCEIRALIELVKLEQVRLENILLVGVDCVGVFSQKEASLKRDVESRVSDYIENLKAGKTPDGVRETCKYCLHFTPENVDVSISLIGRESPVFVFHTEKAVDLAESLGFSLTDGEEKTSKVDELLGSRKEAFSQFEKEFAETISGVDQLLMMFSRCIACHNCRSVCPICYCRDCFFDSDTFEYEAESYERRVNKFGSVRIPLDTVLFHLGRMTHMATSCVGCGMCEDACPVDIPVARAFKFVGSEVQALFEYVPGRSLDEALPLTTYKLDELHEVEDK